MVEAKDRNDDENNEGLVSLIHPTPDTNFSKAREAKSVCLQGRVIGPARRSTKGGWTEEEDKILEFAVQQFSAKNWKKIAECVPNRTAVQCLHRWQKVLDPNLVKGLWTKEEDDLIIELVGKQGNKKWTDIAKHLPGRIGKQCRERWHNHLNPDIKRTAWTMEEELVLINAHNTYGNRWAEIAKLLPGRTENSVKNHWNCSISKKIIQSACASDLSNFDMKVENGNPDSEALRQNFEQRINIEGKRNPITCSLDLVLGTAGARESHLPTSDYRILRTESSNPEHAIAIPLAPEDLTLSFLSYKPLIQLQNLNTPGLGTDDSDRYPTSIQNTSSSITPPSCSGGISSPCQSIISRLRSAARSFQLPSIILQRQAMIKQKWDNLNKE